MAKKIRTRLEVRRGKVKRLRATVDGRSVIDTEERVAEKVTTSARTTVVFTAEGAPDSRVRCVVGATYNEEEVSIFDQECAIDVSGECRISIDVPERQPSDVSLSPGQWSIKPLSGNPLLRQNNGPAKHGLSVFLSAATGLVAIVFMAAFLRVCG